MRGEDHYAILGVARGATAVQIKKAYRILVLRFHPDRNLGDKKAEDQFKKIVRAYEVLSHPERRKQYDLMRNAFQEALAQHRTERAPSAAQPRSRPTPPPRRPPPRERREDRARSTFELESNEFDQRDAAFGAVMAVMATVIAGSMQAGTLSAIVFGALALAAITARYAFDLGVWFAERLLPRASVALESPVRLLPSFFALSAVCIVVWASRWTGTPLATAAIGPAGMAAALAAAGGGGLGRAFTSVAIRPAALWLGLGVAIVVGGFAGSVLGFAFVSLGIRRLFEAAAYDSMFHGALGASIGGACGAFVGAARKRKSLL